MMRVSAFNHSDSEGGAAKAAYRIHQAVQTQGVTSTLTVSQKKLDDASIDGPNKLLNKIQARIASICGVLIAGLIRTPDKAYHSPAIFPTRWHSKINASDDIEVAHFHWINGEMMSVEDIGKVNKPIVWTLHDMWAFSGAEHYSIGDRAKRGYFAYNRPAEEGGIDLNSWTWHRKQRNWVRPLQLVSPSNWLANQVRESALMGSWPVTVIPNPVNTDIWHPIEQSQARKFIGLSPSLNYPLLVFGAIGGGTNPRKGMDLLVGALSKLRTMAHSSVIQGMEIAIFGQNQPEKPIDFGFPVHYLGHISDEGSLNNLYSAADLLVAPSRQEVFGQIASEAHACGCPVVAFKGTGLSDVVDHQITGYLATQFKEEDLAAGIEWVLKQKNIETGQNRLRTASRKRAVEKFSYSVVGKLYADTYKKALDVYRQLHATQPF